MDVPRGLCALRTLEACVPPTTSYFCASTAFGARVIPGINVYRLERLSRGSAPNAWKRQRKRPLEFTGALIRQGDSRLSKRIMLWQLAVQGPNRGGQRATSWGECLEKHPETCGAFPRKGKGRKWVASGVVVKDETGLDDCCKERGHVALGG